MNSLKFHSKIHVFYREKLTNQKNLTSLGNKLVIAGPPAALGHYVIQCNIWHVALMLGIY